MPLPLVILASATTTDPSVRAGDRDRTGMASLDGYTNPTTYIGSRADYAFCLWDAPSIEALQPMLDGLTEGAATNTYFPIDPDAFGTAGIPTQRIDLDTEAHAKA